MWQAIHATRPGGHMGFVGITPDVSLNGMELFFSHVHVHGGPAPVRRFLPDLITRIWDGRIRPGKVFDLTLPLEQAADGYARWTHARPSKSFCVPDGRPTGIGSNSACQRSRVHHAGPAASWLHESRSSRSRGWPVF